MEQKGGKGYHKEHFAKNPPGASPPPTFSMFWNINLFVIIAYKLWINNGLGLNIFL